MVTRTQKRAAFIVVILALVSSTAWGAAGESTHLSEALRASLKKVVVLPGTSPPGQEITGSYENETPGLAGGISKGSQIGKGVSKDVGGIGVSIPFPILTLPGAIIGGVSGLTKRQIQEFRDELTDDLAKSASQPLTNDSLASDVFWGFRKLPDLDTKVLTLTAPIPEDTDAVLYVSVSGVTIEVQGKEAIITTSAKATLRRVSDGKDLYDRYVSYQDRDTLSKWTANDKALWRDYANFARYYIGREIAAQVFEGVEVQNELRPLKTKTAARIKKNDWQGISKSATPTLAWELTFADADPYGPWKTPVDESNVSYELEIFDARRPVYFAKDIREPRHTVLEELEGCKTYRWSVRPSYRVGGKVRFGEWMRINSGSDTVDGSAGKMASEAPAYVYDFASLKVKCRRK